MHLEILASSIENRLSVASGVAEPARSVVMIPSPTKSQFLYPEHLFGRVCNPRNFQISLIAGSIAGIFGPLLFCGPARKNAALQVCEAPPRPARSLIEPTTQDDIGQETYAVFSAGSCEPLTGQNDEDSDSPRGGSTLPQEGAQSGEHKSTAESIQTARGTSKTAPGARGVGRSSAEGFGEGPRTILGIPRMRRAMRRRCAL